MELGGALVFFWGARKTQNPFSSCLDSLKIRSAYLDFVLVGAVFPEGAIVLRSPAKYQASYSF